MAGFLSLSRGVNGLLEGSVISAALTLVLHGYLVHRLLPDFRLQPRTATRSQAALILSFSWKVYLVQAAAALQNHLEKFLLAMFTGVVAVGWYDMASDTATKVRGFPALLLGPILPAASELDVLDERTKLVELYFRAQKYLAFISVPITFLGIALSRRFIDLWIGPSLEVVAIPLRIMLLLNLTNLLTGPGLMILTGQGQLWQGMTAALAGIGAGIPLSIYLIHRFGFEGAVGGAAASSVLSSAIFLYLFHRQTRLKFSRVLKDAYAGPSVCSLALLGIAGWAGLLQPTHWAGLALATVVFGVIYSGLLLAGGFFDHYDLDKFRHFPPVAKFARRFAVGA